MTPAEHYRRAEELLAMAAGQVEPEELSELSPLELLAMAEVHARLASIPAPVSYRGPEVTRKPDLTMKRPTS